MPPRSPIDTPEKFAAAFAVSRETLDRLMVYESLLRRWQKGTNLVAPATLDQLWHRHFADSAQLLRLAPNAESWLDLGSGAGFPGLVIAICAGSREDGRVHVVESDMRKCAFLQEVVRETGCSVEMHRTRIESLAAANKVTGADVVTARALAPMAKLLELAAPFFGPRTRGLFLKGRQAEAELGEADGSWSFEARLHPSLTDGQAHIVEVGAPEKRTPGKVEAAHE